MRDDNKSALLLVGWLAFLFTCILSLMKFIFNVDIPLKNILLCLGLGVLSLVIVYSDKKII